MSVGLGSAQTLLVQDLRPSHPRWPNLFRGWAIEDDDLVTAASALLGFDDPDATEDEGCFLHLIPWQHQIQLSPEENAELDLFINNQHWARECAEEGT